MKQLPPSWGNPTLLDCSQFVRGVTYTKSDASDQPAGGLIPIVRANNIQARRFDFNDLVYVPENLVSAEQALKDGDVVVATSSGSISVVGKAAQFQQQRPMSFGAFCGVLRPSPAINARYFGHFFSSKAYRDAVSDMARGVNINNLKRDHFQAINIPLAPLTEQKRIADKLDTVLTRVDAVNTRLARVVPILKRFRQSVLTAATSGRLTEDWRTRSKSHRSWERVALASVAHDFSYGSAAKSAKEGPVPVLRMGNIQDGRLVWDDLVFTNDAVEAKKYGLRHGDVLFNRTNSPELVGKTAVFKGERTAIFAGYLIRVRCGDLLLPDYLNYCLSSPDGREYCWAVKSDGVSQSNINAKKLAAFELNLPPINEQTVIVRLVETLFAFADRLEARLHTAQTANERLTPALLAKAFRGELVPQDPNDEPASELLCRLQQEVGAASTKRGRKSSG